MQNSQTYKRHPRHYIQRQHLISYQKETLYRIRNSRRTHRTHHLFHIPVVMEHTVYLDLLTDNWPLKPYLLFCQQTLPAVAVKFWCKQWNNIAKLSLKWSVILYSSHQFVIRPPLSCDKTMSMIGHCTCTRPVLYWACLRPLVTIFSNRLYIEIE